MVTSAESVVVSLRPPDEVFAYVADLRNEPSWHDDIAAVPADTDAVPVVGKTYPVTFKPFMGKTDGHYTVLAVEPGTKVVYQATLAGLQPKITYDVAKLAEGTLFTRTVEMHPRGLAVLMTPMMAIMVPRRNRVFVANLKKTLDG
jgi:hypothetical protein